MIKKSNNPIKTVITTKKIKKKTKKRSYRSAQLHSLLSTGNLTCRTGEKGGTVSDDEGREERGGGFEQTCKA